MNYYESFAHLELKVWEDKMLSKPSLFSSLSKNLQIKINSWIPEKVHNAITVAIKQMIRAVLFGSTYTTTKALKEASLQQREIAVQQKIDFYRNTATVEGGVTGAGGILLGLADFPLLLGIKIKVTIQD